jgi:hypothetical protein
MGEVRNAYKIFVGNLEGNRPHGRPKCEWDGNVRKYLRAIGWEGVELMHLAQDGDQWRSVVNIVMKFRVS